MSVLKITLWAATVQKIIDKIKLYLFPESLLSSESILQFREEDNASVRDQIILLSFLIVLIYPCYYFFFDLVDDNNFFWKIFRFGSAFMSGITLIFYYNFKNLKSKFYKLPFYFVTCFMVIAHAYSSVYSDLTTSFSPFIIIMVAIYTLRLTPMMNLLFCAMLYPIIYDILIIGGEVKTIIVSHMVVASVVVILISLRNFTSVRQFMLNQNHNKFLKGTYDQLVHDVKSPLTALKFLSGKDKEADSLLSSATERVEKIILDLENNKLAEIKKYKFNILESIKYIIEESKIKYKHKLSETNIIFEDTNTSGVQVVPIDKATFTRVVSNLLNNAFEAKNSDQHIIKVSISIVGSVFHLKIINSGDGVSASKLARITAKGYSLKGQGRGYGLSYAKEQVLDAGGKFELFSSNGFLVSIKLKVDTYI